MKLLRSGLSEAERDAEVEAHAVRGDVETNERHTAELCPICKREGRRVYRWIRPHADLDGKPDKRWFCYCGYAEEPWNGDWHGWRNP